MPSKTDRALLSIDSLFTKVRQLGATVQQLIDDVDRVWSEIGRLRVARELDANGNLIPDPSAAVTVLTVTVYAATAPSVGRLLVADPAGGGNYLVAGKTANATADGLGNTNPGANANVVGVVAGPLTAAGTNLSTGLMALPSRGLWPYFSGLTKGVVYASDASGAVRPLNSVASGDWYCVVGTALDTTTIEPKLGQPTLK